MNPPYPYKIRIMDETANAEQNKCDQQEITVEILSEKDNDNNQSKNVDPRLDRCSRKYKQLLDYKEEIRQKRLQNYTGIYKQLPPYIDHFESSRKVTPKDHSNENIEKIIVTLSVPTVPTTVTSISRPRPEGNQIRNNAPVAVSSVEVVNPHRPSHTTARSHNSTASMVPNRKEYPSVNNSMPEQIQPHQHQQMPQVMIAPNMATYPNTYHQQNYSPVTVTFQTSPTTPTNSAPVQYQSSSSENLQCDQYGNYSRVSPNIQHRYPPEQFVPVSHHRIIRPEQPTVRSRPYAYQSPGMVLRSRSNQQPQPVQPVAHRPHRLVQSHPIYNQQMESRISITPPTSAPSSSIVPYGTYIHPAAHLFQQIEHACNDSDIFSYEYTRLRQHIVEKLENLSVLLSDLDNLNAITATSMARLHQHTQQINESINRPIMNSNNRRSLPAIGSTVNYTLPQVAHQTAPIVHAPVPSNINPYQLAQDNNVYGIIPSNSSDNHHPYESGSTINGGNADIQQSANGQRRPGLLKRRQSTYQ